MYLIFLGGKISECLVSKLLTDSKIKFKVGKRTNVKCYRLIDKYMYINSSMSSKVSKAKFK